VLCWLRPYWLPVVVAILGILVISAGKPSWAAPVGSPANQSIPATLTLQKTGSGTILADPPGLSYNVGQVVTLTAVADFGWDFVNWSVNLNGTANPAALTMTGNKRVRATFSQQAASTIASDDFNSCALKSRWTFTNPVGDAKLVNNGEQVAIEIPAGVSHDIWTNGNNAPRLMQAANNVDFELEVKFQTPVAQRYQMQGILIEEDAQNFLRINFQSDGVTTTLVGYSFTAGAPTTRVEQAINGAAPIYLRVRRTQNLWQLAYSTDGATWTSSAALEFNQPLTVTKTGVFAGNAGDNPAFNAVIDYFFNTAAPIAPEDPIKNTAPVTVVGEGAVTQSCGNPVTLTATPAAGWRFNGWSGSLTGSQNPAALTLTNNTSVTATFVRKPLQLTVSTNGSGAVQRTPQQSYFDSGESVALTAVPNSGWSFAGWSGDLTGTEPTEQVVMDRSKTVVANFRLLSDTSGIQSDDFNRCALNSSRWSFVNPLNDAALTITGAGAQISVPAGVDHDIWTAGNRAPRLMQPAANTDFELEAKFESALTARYQFHGILVEANAGNFIRFNFQFDGATTSVVAISFADGVPTVRASRAIAAGAPLYMRILRAGNSWSIYYSYNGTAWSTEPMLTFAHELSVTKVGVFAGNAGDNPAFTSVIDYFFNTARPISPEDPVVNTFPPVTVVGKGTVTREPACGNPVTLRATPDANWQFVGWSGALNTATNPVNFTATGQEQITATFAPITGFFSDDFNTCALDSTVWDFIDPLGDATLALKDGQQIELTVPAGTEHDIFPIPNSTQPLNRAPRLMQAISDADFELEVKFASEIRRMYQIQGLLVEQDGENFLRFDFDHDGNSPNLLVMHYANGTPTLLNYEPLTGSAPWYMRVNRTADFWSLTYSNDGLSWTTGYTFTQALAPTQAGVFVGNAGGNPEHTAVIDYFFENGNRIAPEDGVLNQLAITTDGNGSVTKTPDRATYGCGEQVQVRATPANGWVFSGWSGALTGTDNPATLTMDRRQTLTALFKEKKFSLTLGVQGGVNNEQPGSVAASVAGPYYEGQTVTLTATPSNGYRFVKWVSGASEIPQAELTVTISGNTAYTAVFEKVIPQPTVYQLYLPVIAR
jgi:uncharacterized repeat protein (TIGR02543 family)